jgi:hypothetical protein
MLQLVVSYFNGQTGYYTVPDSGWKVEPSNRQIIIGKGVPRKFIPLDNVACYDIEELIVVDPDHTIVE